ncbi:histidine kinase [Methanosarcinales archaeon]|nr:MAG: histidine kinase [Methanosarcinales archaeon]
MRLAAAIELAGIAMTGTGIGIELTYAADAGFFAITMGALLISIGSFIFAKVQRQHQ